MRIFFAKGDDEDSVPKPVPDAGAPKKVRD
jgi:hypothetical protein